MRFNLSAIQMQSVALAQHNLSAVKRLLARLSPSPNQLVLLPENALSFSDKKTYFSLAECLGEGHDHRQLFSG